MKKKNLTRGKGAGACAQNSWEQPIQIKPYVDTGLIKVAPKGESCSVSRVVTEKDVLRLQDLIEQYYDLWLLYPDKFVEAITPPESKFRLYDIQQLILRCMLRYEQVFLTATRGFSKSFVGVFGKIIKCVLIPNTKEFICCDTQKQANAIAQQKVTEILNFLPILKNELNVDKGGNTSFRADNIKLAFKNGSTIDLITPNESYRGLRRNGGLLEEVILMDGELVGSVVIPIVNISRRNSLGEVNENEPQAQLSFVTSAYTKNTYAYERCIETLIKSALAPDKAISLGMSYEVPVMYNMIDKKIVQNVKASGSYSAEIFAREYGSRWTGHIEGAWLDFSSIDKYRVLNKHEFKPHYPSNANAAYYLSVDVGRSRDRTAMIVFKVYKKADYWEKRIVDIKVFNRMSMQAQSIKVRELDRVFGFDKIVVDTNGLGQGLVDALLENTVHPVNGENLLGYNVLNRDQHKQYKDNYSFEKLDKLYCLFTNQHSASEKHVALLSELQKGHIKFLVDETTAKQKLQLSPEFNKLTLNQRLESLMPYKNTTLLINETVNLKIDDKTSAQHLKLIRMNGSAHKDLFSALEYGIWLITEDEKAYFRKLQRGNNSKTQFCFVN